MALKGVDKVVSEANRRANDKYDNKTYARLTIKFRLEDDADIIKALADAKEDGVQYRKIISEWYAAYQEMNK